MARLVVAVDLTPQGLCRLFRPKADEWEALESDVWGDVHAELERHLTRTPDADVLDVIDAACLMESTCEGPGHLALACRDDLHVTAIAGAHWYQMGLGLLAVRVRARLAAAGYRVASGMVDPALIAATPTAHPLLPVGDSLVALDRASGLLIVDEGDERLVPDDTLLATVRSDGLCRCQLCVELRARPQA
ncbi:MAG: hypothetical protein Q8P41_17960 [Pseudomonadota bacterium]|nr:hypothetical protein [Pseudomonadota bacterium]